jgi:hypothetical protein
LLADSNVDYGQNHEKMRELWRGREAAGRHLNPVHVLPGENVLTFNLASGATDFSRHAWLRDHLSPSGHFRHTYLFFDLAPADFERLLAEARRFAPSPRAAEACPKDAPEAVPLDLTVEVRFPTGPPGSVPVVCVWAAATTDLALAQRAGEVLWGRAEVPRREWDRLRGGREAWYRLDPGGHAFVAFEPKEFRGTWTVRGGPATAAVRPMFMRRGRLAPQ